MQTLTMQTRTNQLTLLRTGAVCAILGAVIQVAAGTGGSIGFGAVLSGLAVVSSRRYPALLGWLGFIGGLGSLIAGPLMFFNVEGLPTGLSIVSAVVISIYMLVLGFLMWNPLRDEQ